MLVAHRGFRTPKGENRLVDFEQALKYTKGVEFDIRMTKDKKIIIFHDHHFGRIGGVKELVSNFTYDEIKQIPFFKNNPSYLPPLFIEDFADKLSDKYEFINVEIKPSKYSDNDYHEIKRSLKNLRNKTKAEIVVSSFGINDLKFITTLDSVEFKKGYLVERLKDIDFNLIKKFNYLHPYVGSLKRKEALKIVEKVNLPLNIWTFKKSSDSKKIFEKYGERVYGYISDINDLIIYTK